MKLWRNILVMTAVMLSFASCSSDEPRYADPGHTKRAFSAKECKNYQIMRVVVQSFSLL